MATLCITEYTQAGNDIGAQAIPAPQYPANAKQSVTIPSAALGGQSTNSAPFSAGTRFILINSDTVCWIDIGPNPVAVIGYDRLPQYMDRFIMVFPGQKMAVLAS